MDAVCRDWRSAPITDREKAIFAYLEKVNDAPGSVGPDDVAAAKAQGLDDETLFDAVTVCAAFNFFNRWIDGTGVPKTAEGLYEERLEKSGDLGYAP